MEATAIWCRALTVWHSGGLQTGPLVVLLNAALHVPWDRDQSSVSKVPLDRAITFSFPAIYIYEMLVGLHSTHCTASVVPMSDGTTSWSVSTLLIDIGNHCGVFGEECHLGVPHFCFYASNASL